MDMLELRIREVVATLLAKGAKVLERTASELANAASELRPDGREEDAERAWAEESDDDVQTITRGAPLRAVPDAPTDEADDDGGAVLTPSGAPWTPPAEPPDVVERPGDVDAVVTTSPTVASDVTSTTDRLEDLAMGTVSQIRTQLGDLSPEELRRLKEIELANRKRSTLIAAIDRALIDNA